MSPGRVAVATAICCNLLLGSCATFVRVRDPARGFDAATCTEEAYFAENLCPREHELLRWAAGYPDHPSLADMTPDNLREIAAETGSVDRAAAVFYHRAATADRNERFLRYVERVEKQFARQEAPPPVDTEDVLFVFVPGMFYEDIEIRGLEGEPLLEAARKLGIASAVVPLAQTGTIEDNAGRIAAFLRREAERYRRIIVASASKGSADFAVMLHRYDQSPFVEKIHTWLNVGGILEPSVLADTIEERWWLRARAKAFHWINGYEYDGFRSMSSSVNGRPGVLAGELRIPDHIEVISVVGVPLSEHVTNTTRPFYRVLRDFGPNDGFLLLGRSRLADEVLYPAWRNDHYFQWSLPPERIKAFFAYALGAEISS
jgi:hypothetical protein